MSEGRRVALALGGMYVLVAATILGLLRPWSTDGDATDEASTTTITEPDRPEAGPPTEYLVRPGETLSGIAQRFDVTVEAIVDENRLTDADDLRDGEVLLIPPPPPVWLEVAPITATLGEIVELTLTGARPSETVTFEFRSPNGVYVGPPHTASREGTVSTTYRTSIADNPGIYTIAAAGSEGTATQATLQVEAEDP